MARFRKRANGPGVYATPDGPAAVTPERVRHWHDTLQAVLARGHKPPLSWGHAKGATPHPESDTDFWRSRFNAGRVVGSEIDPATQELILTCESDSVELTPEGKLVSTASLPDGRAVRTEIEEVSIGAADWTDGDGKLWRDAPVHLALTPLPVWVPEGGQPPFEPAENVTRFGTLLYRFATGDKPMADDDKGKKGDDATPGEGPKLKKILEALAKAGIALPDDTTDENFMDRLYAVATSAGGGDGGNKTEPPPTTPAEGDAGTFMSTLQSNPLVQQLVARVEASDKDKRLARIAGLEKRGLKPHLAKKYREEASQMRFAADGKPATLDDRLDALEQALPPEGAYANLTSTVTPQDVREVGPPEGETDQRKKSRELADSVAKAGGLPARKGG